MTEAVIKLFDRHDGTGADWRLMTESLFKAAFVMLDGLPADLRQSVARRVHEGSYNRILSGPLQDDSENQTRSGSRGREVLHVSDLSDEDVEAIRTAEIAPKTATFDHELGS